MPIMSEQTAVPKLKRLVMCLDGTWNTAEAKEVTNVYRIRTLIEPDIREGGQWCQYEPGVGTDGIWFKRRFEGATGSGLEKNVLDAYKHMSRFYHPELEIYIFGFSRGAFTARSLASFIQVSGLLKPEHCDKESVRAWKYYRTARKDPQPTEEIALKKMSFDDVRIKVLGVFDTVGSRGIPVSGIMDWYNEKRFGFHDVTLSPNIDHAFQALAIDERRLSFPPNLWQGVDRSKTQTVEQVWFAGNHGNIGGGYSDTSLSNIALKWMMTRMEAKVGTVGLFKNNWRELEYNYSGNLNDETRHNALYAVSRVYPTIRVINQCRPKPKVFGREVGLPPHGIPICEAIHYTALERLVNLESYKPPNLLAALFDMEAGKTSIPIVGGKFTRLLDWLNNARDRNWLFDDDVLSPRLKDRLGRIYKGFKDASGASQRSRGGEAAVDQRVN